MSADITLLSIREGMSEAVRSSVKIHSIFPILSAAVSGRDDQGGDYKHRVFDQELNSVLEVFADQAEELVVLLDRLQCDYDRLIDRLDMEAHSFQGGDK